MQKYTRQEVKFTGGKILYCTLLFVYVCVSLLLIYIHNVCRLGYLQRLPDASKHQPLQMASNFCTEKMIKWIFFRCRWWQWCDLLASLCMWQHSFEPHNVCSVHCTFEANTFNFSSAKICTYPKESSVALTHLPVSCTWQTNYTKCEWR